MISDVLHDAVAEIDRYLADPVMGRCYDDLRLDIQRLREQMEMIRARLDTPPSYVGPDGGPVDEATRAAMFRPMSPDLFLDPVCGAELRRLAVEDPDVIKAVAEVDRSLLWSDDGRSPLDKLCEAVDRAEWLAQLGGAQTVGMSPSVTPGMGVERRQAGI